MNIRSESTILNNATHDRLPAGMGPLGSHRRLRLALLAIVIIIQLTVGGSRVSAQTETRNPAVNCQEVRLPVSLHEGQPAKHSLNLHFTAPVFFGIAREWSDRHFGN
jgi:hypothetical protein